MVPKKVSKIIEKIIIIIFIIFAIILVIQILLKLIGGSPTDIQILYVGFGVIISYLLIMSFKIGVFMGKVNEFMINTKVSFRKIREDVSKKRR